MSGEALILRNAEVGGVSGLDVRLEGGLIAAVGARLAGPGRDLDAAGGALIPGLADHHIHLLATAARRDSLALETVTGAADLARRLRAFAASRPPGTWLRAGGYHERMAGLLSAADLDALVPAHPLRLQHQTGSLWMLNSLALERVMGGEIPEAVERDAAGAPTGRIWRGDAWLGGRIGRTAPPLAPLGAELAALGITALTDASVTTEAEAAALLAQARRDGALPQRLTLMSAGPLDAPADGAWRLGPVKILLDDHDLPPFDDMVGRIAFARTQGRAVAVHCVTAGELALTLAAFHTAGARPGDRIEHGGVIPADAMGAIAGLGLTVVTQPAFVFERGDRYLAEVAGAEQGDLYRCASLLAAGAPVAGSSDAPYGDPDPWAAMRAATRRRTRAGRPIGPAEAVTPERALALWLGDPADPGGPPRRIAPGAGADLCLLRTPLAEALDALDRDLVAATFVGGEAVFGQAAAGPDPEMFDRRGYGGKEPREER